VSVSSFGGGFPRLIMTAPFLGKRALQRVTGFLLSQWEVPPFLISRRETVRIFSSLNDGDFRRAGRNYFSFFSLLRPVYLLPIQHTLSPIFDNLPS